MTLVIVGVEALVIVLLLGALLVGQPAAVQSDRLTIATQTALIASYRAAMFPTPTPPRRP